MRLSKLPAFYPLLLAVLAVAALSLQAQETDTSSHARGTAPRNSAEKYKAHAARGNLSIGGELLTRKEVSKEFAADLNSCCLVVQVAVYPKPDESLQLVSSDFTLLVEGNDVGATAQSATVVSAKLTKDETRGVTTAANVGVGVEFGTYTDPVTGQTVHVRGVTTSAGVGVGAGGNPPPAAVDRHREVIERELSEKGLPEAKISVPVSGYLYFSPPKQKKHAKYRLEYAIKDETLVLALP